MMVPRSEDGSTNLNDPRDWWRVNWQQAKSWSTCSRCGVLILVDHLRDGACIDKTVCDERVRLVATSGGLEAVGFVTLDDRGMPGAKS